MVSFKNIGLWSIRSSMSSLVSCCSVALLLVSFYSKYSNIRTGFNWLILAILWTSNLDKSCLNVTFSSSYCHRKKNIINAQYFKYFVQYYSRICLRTWRWWICSKLHGNSTFCSCGKFTHIFNPRMILTMMIYCSRVRSSTFLECLLACIQLLKQFEQRHIFKFCYFLSLSQQLIRLL